MKKIIYLFITGVIFAFSSCSGGSNACACLDEMNTMRINSSLYQSCIDKAIMAGETSDPYGYFERQCNK